MKLFWRKKHDEILLMEQALQETLVPLEPRAEFVDSLRQNLLLRFPQSRPPAVETRSSSKLQTAIFLASGITGSILLAISGLRGLISLAAAIALLVNWWRQDTRQRTPTMT